MHDAHFLCFYSFVVFLPISAGNFFKNCTSGTYFLLFQWPWNTSFHLFKSHSLLMPRICICKLLFDYAVSAYDSTKKNSLCNKNHYVLCSSMVSIVPKLGNLGTANVFVWKSWIFLHIYITSTSNSIPCTFPGITVC